MFDTVPRIDLAAPADELPQDRLVDRRWFLGRVIAASVGGAAVTGLAAQPAGAASAARAVTPYATALHIRQAALDDLTELTIAEAQTLIRRGELSAVELIEAYLERIDIYEDIYLAFNYLAPREQVVAEAEAIVGRRTRDPLAGIAMAPKDNYYTHDMPTTANSPIFAGFVPDYDATCVARLRAAGSVVLGKAQMGALASGRGVIPGTNIPTTRNAWTPDDIRYSPSGSSGGTATAVAARLATGGIGTQTGGSITSPSRAQGLTGMAPTYGRTSLYGVIPLTYTVDRTGPIARDAKDCAMILQQLAGADENDARTRGLPPVPDFVKAATPVVRNGRVRPRFSSTIGVPPGYFDNTVEGELRAAAADTLASIGFPVVEVSLPDDWDLIVGELSETQAASGAHYFMPFMKQDVLQFGPRLTGFLPYVLRSGAGLLTVQQANVVLLEQIIDQLFAQCDAVFADSAGDFNRPGLPTITFPVGFNTDATTGLTVPRGVVLSAPPFGEERLLSIAGAYQAVTDHHLQRPPDPTLPTTATRTTASTETPPVLSGRELRDLVLANNAAFPVASTNDPDET